MVTNNVSPSFSQLNSTKTTSLSLSISCLQEELGSRSLVIVYVPTNHIYVGDIFMLGPEDIIHTSLTVGEGLGEQQQQPLETNKQARLFLSLFS